jgi:CxxC motif-containing protein (DUF1111 family)
MKNSLVGRTVCVLLLAATSACQQSPEPLPAGKLGAAIAGLDEASLDRFQAGEALFNRVFLPENGLGPLFNGDQCSACHTSPVTGGTGDQFVHRASRFDAPERCDLLSAEGGENIRIIATPQLRAQGIERQPFPEQATERVRFNVPFIFGLGLVDAVPETQITQRADPEDSDRDGISGRAGKNARGQFSRFGRKADQPTLRAFVENAAHQEMGLTTALHPSEGTIAGMPFPAGIDPKPEPELSDADVELITDFVRFLTPVAQRKPERERQTIDAGERLFNEIGCTKCHTPTMTTGQHEIDALSNKRFFIYSDLLLHDLGPQIANVCASGATPSEMRTEPLVGVGLRNAFLHDSRTRDLTEAIRMHGGEASAVQARFQGLKELQQHDLIRFLQSL